MVVATIARMPKVSSTIAAHPTPIRSLSSKILEGGKTLQVTATVDDPGAFNMPGQVCNARSTARTPDPRTDLRAQQRQVFQLSCGIDPACRQAGFLVNARAPQNPRTIRPAQTLRTERQETASKKNQAGRFGNILRGVNIGNVKGIVVAVSSPPKRVER